MFSKVIGIILFFCVSDILASVYYEVQDNCGNNLDDLCPSNDTPDEGPTDYNPDEYLVDDWESGEIWKLRNGAKNGINGVLNYMEKNPSALAKAFENAMKKKKN